MIIVNADDWGCTRNDTDKALSCYRKDRITSVSAMVFMEDSCRAADLANDIGIDVGLHLNLDQSFTGKTNLPQLDEYHNRVNRFFKVNKYAFLFYNPALRSQFRYVYQAQVEEFMRLYERPPSHIDGHHHLHLCANMLMDNIIPKHEKVRRNFSFWPGEKNFLNRTYRYLIDIWLAKRYILTDYFLDLSQCLKTQNLARVAELSRTATVELMTHPANSYEYAYLMSDNHIGILHKLGKGTYALL